MQDEIANLLELGLALLLMAGATALIFFLDWLFKEMPMIRYSFARVAGWIGWALALVIIAFGLVPWLIRQLADAILAVERWLSP